MNKLTVRDFLAGLLVFIFEELRNYLWIYFVLLTIAGKGHAFAINYKKSATVNEMVM
jgi:hypothetical protein